jgi:TPP-dependent pyruvate/acetoin dehydrogenase alpha subunit
VTADELITFEKGIAADFEAGLIAAPVHLAGGNEDQLISIFEQIDKENDWICVAWRSHLHCLLKGVPADELRDAIHKGRSIALCFPDHKVISSAIVGGIAPIAVGLAFALKRQGKPGKVWCFLGDMTARSGLGQESFMYAQGHSLPIEFVVENNKTSVCTDTDEAWGRDRGTVSVRVYEYNLTFPHVGTGKWVRF